MNPKRLLNWKGTISVSDYDSWRSTPLIHEKWFAKSGVHISKSPPDLGVSKCEPRDERIRDIELYWDIDGMLASLRSLLWGRAHDGQVILIQESIHPALQPSSSRSTAGRVPSSRVPEFRSDLSAIRDKQVQIRTLQPKLVPQEYFHVAVAISGPKRWRSFQVRSTFRYEKPQNMCKKCVRVPV